MKTTKNEVTKMSKNNWLENLTEQEKYYYDKACVELQKKYDKFDQPTYKEIKAKINKARRQGKLYETTDRNNAFKYIATWRYTADRPQSRRC